MKKRDVDLLNFADSLPLNKPFTTEEARNVKGSNRSTVNCRLRKMVELGFAVKVDIGVYSCTSEQLASYKKYLLANARGGKSILNGGDNMCCKVKSLNKLAVSCKWTQLQSNCFDGSTNRTDLI